MTPQEAIKIIKDPNRHYKAKADGAYEYKEFVEALELAAKALEKQIQKKPLGIYDENEQIIKDNLYEPALFGVCPDPDCTQEVQDGEIHCSFCGQALDWSKDK